MSSKPNQLRVLVTGTIAGIAAYLAGYFITYLWKAHEIQEALGPINMIAELFGAETIQAWKIVGWLYHSAHFVDTKITVGPVGPQFVNLIQSGSGSLEILYVVPPLIILLVGFGVTFWHGIDTRLNAMLTGARITIGYLLCTIIGAIVFQIGGSGPDLIPTIVLAGVVYPLVFGALGGLAAQILRQMRTGSLSRRL